MKANGPTRRHPKQPTTGKNMDQGEQSIRFVTYIKCGSRWTTCM